MARKESDYGPRQKFRKGFARATRFGYNIAQSAAIMIPMAKGLPIQAYSPDTHDEQKNAQQIKSPKLRTAKHQATGQYTYNRAKSDASLAAQDKKTGIHSPPPVDLHEGGGVQGSQVVEGQSFTLNSPMLTLPVGVQLAGFHNEVVTRNQQQRADAERKTAFEAEISQIRLLDSLAQKIGLDTAQVTESLLTMAQMKGDNIHFLADAKTYLTETLLQDGPRAFAALPPAQITELANQLKWNNWKEILPDLQGVSQRTQHQAKAMGEELARIMGNAENTLDDIKDFVNAMADVFKEHPGIILPTILYAGSLGLIGDGVRRMVKSKGKLDRVGLIEADAGGILAMLGCGFTAALTPMPAVGAPSELPAISTIEPTVAPLIIETPVPAATAADTTTYVDISTLPGIDAVIDSTGGIGHEYIYSNDTKLVTAADGSAPVEGNQEILSDNAEYLRSMIRATGVEPGEIRVYTNGAEGDNSRNESVAFSPDGKSILYPQVQKDGSIKYAVSPSSTSFAAEDGVTPEDTIRFGNVKLPKDTKVEDVVVRWIGEQRIVQATDANGSQFIFNTANGEWVSIDMPSTKMARPSIESFSSALNNAGLPFTPEQLLEQGFQTETIIGIDGKPYTIAYAHLDPDATKEGEANEGEWAVMIKDSDGSKWKGLKPGEFEALTGIKVFIAGNYDNIVSLGARSPHEFSGLNVEWAFHLDVSHKDEKTIDYGMIDYALDMSKASGMGKATGGMLIWDNGNLPSWFQDYKTKETLLPVLENHISKITSKYKGKIDTWTVVNEPFKPGNKASSYWNDIFGEDHSWIKQAFVVADKNDPNAKLILNDYGIEFFGKDKYEDIYNLCKELKSSGTPIDGIGFEMHIYANDLITGVQSYDDLRKSIKEFQALGLEVQFTELDVDMSGVAGSNEEKLKKQADIYFQLGKMAAEEGVTNITIFGEKDDTSWIKKESAMPTFFDKNYKKKLPYFAFMQGLIAGSK